jgi:glutathione S-transferase
VNKLILYFAPDTCARVPLTALEEIGCPYELEVIKFVQKQHRSAAYLALNPQGKVPTLLVDGKPLTENLAILSWLAERFPEAGLLPRQLEGLSKWQVLADLSYCASGLHPIVTRIRIPQFFCDAPEATARVYQMATAAMRPNFALIDQRLSQGQWWYADTWSIVDAYLNWVWFRVTGAGFDGSPYPHFAAHDEALGRRPAVQRALRKNAAIAADLAAQGLAIKFAGEGAVTAPPAS